MSIKLSVTADSLLKEIGIRPQIILDIEGVDLVFGWQPVLKVVHWDDANAYWDDGLFWDGKILNEQSRDYISLEGTTNNVSQQIEPDKGSISSVSTVNVTLVDYNNEVSRKLSFNTINEILGRKATLSVGLAEGTYPEDANPVFRGVIVDFYTQSGKVMLSIASSESLKRQSLLEKIQFELTQPVNTTDTFIYCSSVTSIYEPGLDFESYIRIDDEIMKVVSLNTMGTIGIYVERAKLNTVVSSHDVGASGETFYVIKGKPLDIARRVMLSSDTNDFFNSLEKPVSINYISLTESIENALIFDYYDIKEKTGLVLGDVIQLTSTLNNSTYQIREFGRLDNGKSYIKVSDTLQTEQEYTDDFLYRSQWAQIPFGLGMLPSEVDLDQFALIDLQYGGSFVEYEFYIKDTIENAKDWLDQEVLFPQGLYSIPRKARASVKYVAPPFSSDIVPTLNLNSITNITNIRQRRSIHKYFYNTFVFRYNVDSLEDKYLTGKIYISTDSIARINLGRKVLKVESDGLRNTSETELVLNNLAQRLIDRYRFAPVYFDDIEINYKTGYKIEVGDVIPFGSPELKLIDLNSGESGSREELFEVVNKSLNLKTGKIKLSLVSTAFNINARYAVIAVASFIGLNSTHQRIEIKRTNDTDDYSFESDKWLPYIGLEITVRSNDYQFEEIKTLVGVDGSDKRFLLLDSPLSFVPGENYIVEPRPYDDSSIEANNKFKIEFAYHNAQAVITAVTDNKTFEVDDASKLVIGSRIYVHSKDFTRDSFGVELTIDQININEVTLSDDLSFTPVIGDYLENSNYKDGAYPYNLI